jgi:Tol biopolymer transport system component
VPANEWCGGDSGLVSISADGRFVVFSSLATNLVHGIDRPIGHLYAHDRETGETSLVDVRPDGSPSEGSEYPYYRASISSDGRFVAFESASPTLVTGDTNEATDIFVRDRQSGETTRVSVDSLGAQAGRSSYSPSISGDGRYVAFASDAANLVPNDTNECTDVFVHDRATRRTIRVSVDSSGAQSSYASQNAVISADGRCVAFDSFSSNLVPDDTNQIDDVFVHDLTTGRTERASVNSYGEQGTLGFDGSAEGSILPAISGDGRFVAFLGDAAHLDHYSRVVGIRGYFLHDRVTGSTTRVSVNSSGVPATPSSIYYQDRPAISADGRFVAFACRAPLVADDHHAWTSDVFVHDLRTGETTLQSRSSSGVVGNLDSFDPALSADGSVIAFASGATNLVAEDTHGFEQIFVRGRLAHDLVESFCAGDGSTATTCPCFNFGGRHRGCASSEVATGALLATTGRPSNDTLTLVASGETSTALTVFIQGSASANGGVAFGDGVLCLSGTLKRLFTRIAVGGSAFAPDVGEPSLREQSALLGDPIPPGDMRFYQAYYREPDATFCSGGGFNVTNAVLVGW